MGRGTGVLSDIHCFYTLKTSMLEVRKIGGSTRLRVSTFEALEDLALFVWVLKAF